MLAASLTACSNGKSEPFSGLSGITIPWGDYEETLYQFTANGSVSDDVKFIIEKKELDGRQVYEIQSPILLKEGEYVTGAIVEADTMKPLSSYVLKHPPEQYKDKRIDIKGTYGEKLEIEAISANGTQNVKVNLNGESLDNESSLMALRTLPLNQDYKRIVNICIISTAKSAPFEVEVKGKEKITVPFGEVECYKCDFHYKGTQPSTSMTIWYSADDKKTMVKYVQASTVFELKSVKYEKSGE